jgi:hypothetical protein
VHRYRRSVVALQRRVKAFTHHGGAESNRSTAIEHAATEIVGVIGECAHDDRSRSRIL